MSGHSKWSTIKHKKAVEDQKRGKIFTKLGKAISLAARDGGDDLSSNFKLRLAVDKAKQLNMPKDNIKRAIEKGAGTAKGASLNEVTYDCSVALYMPSNFGYFKPFFLENRLR